MRKFIRPFILTAAALFIASGLFIGCHHPDSPDPEQMKAMVLDHVEEALADINATEEQEEQILPMLEEFIVEVQAQHSIHRETRHVVTQELLSPAPRAEVLHELVDLRMEDFRRLAHKGVNLVLKVHALLTPSQRTQIHEMIQEHCPEMEE